MSKKSKYERSFSISLNMQNPPKPMSQNWYVRYADSDSNPEHTVLNYEFTLDKRHDSFGIAEGSSIEKNFRKSFIPEEGHYLVSRDYSGQELRILANLSGETTWIETFLSGGDIHAQTAISVWGKENYSHDKRNMAKAINFGLVYGTGAQGLSNNIGSTVEEAQSYIDTFFKNFPNIDRFLQRQARLGGQNKQVTNYYGRIRRFNDYISRYNSNELSPEGVRRAYNFPIQGMGADVTKLGLLNVYHNVINNPAYLGKALFMSTIHDEINLSVEASVLKEVTKLMGDVMEHKLGNMPVPITTGLSIGTSMGLLWEFEQDPETLELTPIYDKLEE